MYSEDNLNDYSPESDNEDDDSRSETEQKSVGKTISTFIGTAFATFGLYHGQHQSQIDILTGMNRQAHNPDYEYGNDNNGCTIS